MTARGRRLILRSAQIILVTALLSSAGAVIGVLVLSKDLPEIRSLADYKPKQSTVVFGHDGQIAARFAAERRTVVPTDQIPAVIIDAVVAAEDAEFFKHEGLDYFGILRCAVRNILSGRTRCGASTITQQTVKTFLLSPERTLARKAREIILTKRVEDRLSKNDILYLYLNQIYFGHGAYGVEEAARVYFGKGVARLSVEEAALLAGLPQSPGRLDPYRHPERAVVRRAYVLGQLHGLKKIDDATFSRAKATPLALDWNSAESALDSNNHYAAHVKKLLEEQIGEPRASEGGHRVYSGIDSAMQKSAEDALRRGLRAVDKRQGWRGPLLHLETNQLNALRALLEERRSAISPALAHGADANVIWDLSSLSRRQVAGGTVDEIGEEARFLNFELERIYGGLVTVVDDTGREAVVDLGGELMIRLPLASGLSWARRFDLSRTTPQPKTPSQVLKVGDVVLVRATQSEPARGSARDPDNRAWYRGILEQEPRVQGALIAIDPRSREVRALVGGYGVGAGTFNRAIQARRQAGSTFKPIVFAAAFETGAYSPISPCLDAPRVYRDPWTGQAWKPENYGGGFDGEITLRTALTRSKNMCSVELIDRITIDPVLNTAKRVGISSPLPRSLTLALGSGEVTPLEMTNAYATFAAEGLYSDPLFIRKIVEPAGGVVFEAPIKSAQALRPEIAYQITHMMQSVVESGTAQKVTELGRPVAGKTGTTNDARDAWFIGFTPDLVAGVWVGFDNNDPLGPGETGGRAAIPIWLEFVKEVVKDMPTRDFVAPSGIVFALVDPRTRKLAPPEFEGARFEPFIAGTEPTELTESAKPPDSFGIDDYQ